jgi:anaerobic selenocysteine-containing dehydrogenase
VRPPERANDANAFFLSTRRGRQFNSMVHADRDPLNGATRDAILIAKEDADRLGLAPGDALRLRRGEAHFDGRAFLAPIKPGNLQVHWPEGNVLVPKETCDGESGVPDYNAIVTVEKR